MPHALRTPWKLCSAHKYALDAMTRLQLWRRSGSDDGRVRVWNFSSGACLKTLRMATKHEVTDVLCSRNSMTRFFLAAGWDRKACILCRARSQRVCP
jgi:WD40 repeat protein